MDLLRLIEDTPPRTRFYLQTWLFRDKQLDLLLEKGCRLIPLKKPIYVRSFTIAVYLAAHLLRPRLIRLRNPMCGPMHRIEWRRD